MTRQSPKIEGFSDLEEVGRGGFSTVYSARQDAFGRRVAIKVLDFSGSEARRFEREANALGVLSEIPGILTPYTSATTTDGRPCLVMPLMATSLAHRLAEDGPQSLADVMQWLEPVARALDAAHERGVFHRDIKPANILISATGTAHLADFGIAAIGHVSSGTVTTSSLSPPHAPPERLEEGEENPAAGDLYSLASTVITALTGAPPFGTTAEGGVAGLVSRVLTADPPQVPSLSVPANAAIARGLARRPEDRFPTAGAFVQALDASGSDLQSSGHSASRETDPGLPTRPGAHPGPGKEVSPWWVDSTGGSASTTATGLPPRTTTPSTPQPEDRPGSNEDENRSKPWWVALVVMVVGVALGSGAFALVGPDADRRLTIRVELDRSENSPPRTFGIEVGRQRWASPEGTRAFIVPTSSTTITLRLPEPFRYLLPAGGTDERLAIEVGPDRVRFETASGALYTRRRSNPEREARERAERAEAESRRAREAEGARVAEALGPLADLNSRLWVDYNAIYGPDNSASRDELDAGFRVGLVPLLDQADQMIAATSSTDPTLQNGIAEVRQCWELTRAFLLEVIDFTDAPDFPRDQAALDLRSRECVGLPAGMPDFPGSS